ncbi:type I-E CRISPR-associated protein Cas6/Cse3/CasE [Neptunomonas phycophila]|uniref:type I-E CRISPR-associated protein Cas6/Cse3/CasE n=1 Tax=Neptunomonas phycophila TaxID=1572645 RepID=UPI0030F4B95C
MYLSKVTLQRTAQAAKQFLELDAKGAYASHQLLWKLFLGETERGFLFREDISRTGLPEFYVLSLKPPQGERALFNIQTKAFNPRIYDGQRLSFKLRVNPTVCITDAEGRSKRHDVIMHAKHQSRLTGEHDQTALKIVMDNAAHQWIANEKRLAGWGVSLDFLPEIERYTQHEGVKKANKISFSSIDFQGVLTVNDSAVFVEKLKSGFGRSKALGCGLMLIRPV